MTAEIAIINRHAIALAADSAVTVGQDKVWKTANKLFSLGPHHDIAIMVYGAGDFLGLAWESIIKEYRRRCSKRKFSTVSECAAEFKKFLMDEKLFSRDDQQSYSVLFPTFDAISSIDTSSSDEEVFRALEAKSAAYKAKSFEIALDDLEVFRAHFEGALVSFCENQFERNPSKKTTDAAVDLAINLFRSKVPSRYHSGVVVAGFGSDEFFPALSHHIVDGRWKSNLRWWNGEHCKDLNTTDHHDEYPIVPFAQDDMSYQFMTGISNEYVTFLGQSLEKAIRRGFDQVLDELIPDAKKEIAKKRSSEMATELSRAVMSELYEKVRSENYEPINRAVASLPKEEMAIVAESLVDLTSLKRKVDSQLESVGGPVDVAVISKGDGFIWIKRKFYFDSEKNSEFFVRKKLRDGDGHE